MLQLVVMEAFRSRKNSPAVSRGKTTERGRAAENQTTATRRNRRSSLQTICLQLLRKFTLRTVLQLDNCSNMTIPATSNWCPACEEACHDHASVCTVCGETLTTPPGRQRHESSSSQARTAASTTNNRTLPTLLEVLPELRQANQDLQAMIRRIRQQIEETHVDQERLWQDLQQARQEWQTPPAEWLDPSATTEHGGIRATSKAYLESLPRTVLQEHSSILWQPLVAFSSSESKNTNGQDAVWTIEGTVGDFGIPLPSNPYAAQGIVILASPRAGRGGILSTECMALVQNAKKQQQAVFLYFDRGDLTFVQKALLAQKAGATACLIGNHVTEPWPYFMKDSKKEALTGALSIPTVLLPKHAAIKLKSSLDNAASRRSSTVVSAHLDISPTTRSSDCVVCTESFVQGATVVRFPECGHLFHEVCALPWLQKHNTCMYCRRELPTDDQEYERERRRTQRTHAGSSPQHNTEYHNFYG